ncbi:MAG: hypothetical protein LBF08_01555 [Dysgonamonadaceae bacterium]|jgi:hypothetical protein|nr:hypothetical protein [Dysgonamonadaceae bacterium]
MKKILVLLAVLTSCFPIQARELLLYYGKGTHTLHGRYDGGGTHIISENSGEVTLILDNLYMRPTRDIYERFLPSIDIERGNKVIIELHGYNDLEGGAGLPAIRIHPLSEVIFKGTGKLVARGGTNYKTDFYQIGNIRDIPGGAGIGGGWNYRTDMHEGPTDLKFTQYVPDDSENYIWHFKPWKTYDYVESMTRIPDEYIEDVASWWNAQYDKGIVGQGITGQGATWMWMFSKGWGACGSISIEGGDIEAYGGGDYAPGIGPSGEYTKGGTVKIISYDATVYAQGGRYAPGIGVSKNAYMKEILIGNGDRYKVTAIGGEDAPGIGAGGPYSYIENINIDGGGTVIAKGGGSRGVGIGVGTMSKINSINIRRADVTAESNSVPGIGALYGSAIENIQFSDGCYIRAKNGIGKNKNFVTSEDRTLLTLIRNIYFKGGVIETDYLGRGDRDEDGWLKDMNLPRSFSLLEIKNFSDKYSMPFLEEVEPTVYHYESGTVIINSYDTLSVAGGNVIANVGKIVFPTTLTSKDVSAFEIRFGNILYTTSVADNGLSENYEKPLQLPGSLPSTGELRIYHKRTKELIFIEDKDKRTVNNNYYTFHLIPPPLSKVVAKGCLITHNGKTYSDEMTVFLDNDNKITLTIKNDDAVIKDYIWTNLTTGKSETTEEVGEYEITLSGNLARYEFTYKPVVRSVFDLEFKGDVDTLLVQGGDVRYSQGVYHHKAGAASGITIKPVLTTHPYKGDYPTHLKYMINNEIYESMFINRFMNLNYYTLQNDLKYLSVEATHLISYGITNNTDFYNFETLYEGGALRGTHLDYGLTPIQVDDYVKPGGSLKFIFKGSPALADKNYLLYGVENTPVLINGASISQYVVNNYSGQRLILEAGGSASPTPPPTPLPTSIDKINETINVYRSGDYLYNDAAEEIRIYNVSGILVYKGKEAVVKLPKGFLVVKGVSGWTKKI